MTPIIVNRTSQRTARRAIKTKIANKTTAPMMNMVDVDIQSFRVQSFQFRVLQPVTPTRNSELGTLNLRFRVARPHHRLNIPADVKISFDLHTQRIAGLREIFENHIDDMLMKNLDVAK